jgi:hypothetical protein
LNKFLKLFVFLVEINTKYTHADFRDLLTELLTVPKQTYVLANFLRTEVYQEGGGHFSPLVALDPVQDMVLIAGKDI